MANDAAEALEDIEPDLKTRPEVIAVRVGIYEFLKRWEEMAMMAKLLVKMLPDDPKWWIKLAAGTRRHKSIEAAAEILLQAELKHPKDATIQYNLACCCCRLGKTEEAKHKLGTAISLNTELRKLAVDDPDLVELF